MWQSVVWGKTIAWRGFFFVAKGLHNSRLHDAVSGWSVYFFMEVEGVDGVSVFGVSVFLVSFRTGDGFSPFRG